MPEKNRKARQKAEEEKEKLEQEKKNKSGSIANNINPSYLSIHSSIPESLISPTSPKPIKVSIIEEDDKTS